MQQKEYDRLAAMVAFDAMHCGQSPAFGMDEAGRGALVGPVVAACVHLDRQTLIEGINDSKLIAENRREAIAKLIRRQALSYGVGAADVCEIEELNILQATKLAMKRAYEAMEACEGMLLIDAIDPSFLGVRGVGIVKGDSKSYAIAAASILAKTHRDSLMRELATQYPAYGFDVHKGYGTKVHIEAIKTNGPCPVHRLSFLKGILHEQA